MKTKIVRNFIDKSFGFPVLLHNVKLIQYHDDWIIDVHPGNLSRAVLMALVFKPARLTGAEIRFIRQHFEMTMAQFAKRFYVTHPAVVKWEKRRKTRTDMNWSTEKDIRLFILTQLEKTGDKLRIAYIELEKVASEKNAPIEIRADALAA